MIAGRDALKGYYVCRQWYYYTNEMMVEITEGGLDYSGPDQLVEQYPGEGETYDKPQSAALAALKIQKLWQDHVTDREIFVCVRSETAGYLGLEGDPMTPGEVARWAREAWQALPRCAHCNGVMPSTRERWGNDFTIFEENEYPFCSEYCADEDYYFLMEDMEEE